MGLYANAQGVAAALLDRVRAAPGNDVLVRRYYEIYITLLSILETAQSDMLERVRTVLHPRLDALQTEAQELQDQAQRYLASVREGAQVEAVTRNLAAQAAALDIIQRYREHLSRQAEKLTEALDLTRAARDIAANTIRTTQLVADITTLVRDTERDFNLILQARPPAILPFEGDAAMREFDRISQRLLAGRT